ncbi:50S ribosomal protein L3 N(5)-glutamine methyltransferase [Alkalilimnicola ehrlichii]|uniref:Ribosomal protein uL3 glutamine methyltransferase n=1 Tax=Alkalilimnicola ehrlichii TaxID=351052 RepID=A0A3E0X0A6_9GAMM|nr:50S ribosomal protein L3 N(5)-glutamine methyltransferase [Alkalilimnicola ehrlichii]RFA30902.1 50S ribosomal protein L3 N(5)-glutamine methyltransferase [Alkalilimnicola ehrlichii]RFA38852.1 50S ribosomal protein L3 N(5)-glutamine methyltransferase [Alkalilimnicola ehrlichii]
METLSEAPAELETVLDYVRWAASRFQEAGLVFGHGTETALDEAAALVLYTLHMPMDLPSLYFGAKLTRSEREAVVARVNRRIRERLPLPYLTHEAWFMGLPFYVDERVLVPRSPIAELIEARFEPWVDPDAVRQVVDLGTGSGCIAIACAYAFPDAQVTAVDVSPSALEVAKVNVDRHHVGEQLQLCQSDLFESIPAEQRFDIIVSNPPYVDLQDMSRLPLEFQREPQLGLAGGSDGLDIVRRILAQAEERLTENGVLIVEVGNSAPALEAAYPHVPFLWLDFERGGDGVFLLTAEQIRDCRAYLRP